eukprot:359937-Chlamydomonas_euryale.AAC.28
MKAGMHAWEHACMHDGRIHAWEHPCRHGGRMHAHVQACMHTCRLAACWHAAIPARRSPAYAPHEVASDMLSRMPYMQVHLACMLSTRGSSCILRPPPFPHTSDPPPAAPAWLARDLKPANLLMGSDGRVRLSDFGIAVPAEQVQNGDADPDTADADGAGQRGGSSRAAGRRGAPSGGFHKHRMMGTLEYMAPEVLLKQPVSLASDVYAFAGVARCGCIQLANVQGGGAWMRRHMWVMAAAGRQSGDARMAGRVCRCMLLGLQTA